MSEFPDNVPPNPADGEQTDAMGEPTTRNERSISRWEKKIRRWFDKEEEILKEYQQRNGADFIMAEFLMSLHTLEEAMRTAKEEKNKASDPKEKMLHITMLAKLQKQHLDTISKIAKYQETTYHTRIKESRKNKSAAPGQQVGQPAATNGAALCSSPINTRF